MTIRYSYAPTTPVGLVASSTTYNDGKAYTKTTTGFDAAGRSLGTKVSLDETGLNTSYTTSQTWTSTGLMATVKVGRLNGATRRTSLAYNLEVDGIHTYHVGVTEVLVHNECPDASLDSEGEAYVRAKHTESGERRDSTKGYFYDDEDLYDLADASEGVPATRQGNGNCVRVCDAKRQVGVDVETGLPTSKYTVVSDRFGSVRTMHPGLPR